MLTSAIQPFLSGQIALNALTINGIATIARSDQHVIGGTKEDQSIPSISGSIAGSANKSRVSIGCYTSLQQQVELTFIILRVKEYRQRQSDAMGS